MCAPKSEIKNEAVAVNEKKCTGKCKECREKKAREQVLIKTIGVMALMLFSTVVFARDAAAAQPDTSAFWNDPFNHPMFPVYIVLGLIFATVILVAMVGIYMIRIINLLTAQAEKERAEKLGIAYVPRPTWWSRFNKTVNAAVPVAEEQSIELDHDYDGIKELDNHLPPWWKWLFVGTIIWGTIYLFVYHVSSDMPLQLQEYENELTRAEEAAVRLAASQPQAAIDENTLVYAADEAILRNGKIVFTTNCVACHNSTGGGNAIGPNLTDAYWLHGGEIKNIFATVKNGVVEKGMPAWGKAMSPKDVRDVTFYVMSLQGTNPPNAKAPQGELFTPAPVKTDTVKAQASL